MQAQPFGIDLPYGDGRTDRPADHALDARPVVVDGGKHGVPHDHQGNHEQEIDGQDHPDQGPHDKAIEIG